MDEPTNSDRAEWARAGLMAFGEQTRQVKDGVLDDDLASIIGDFICDLNHLCDQEGLDFEELVARGRFHHGEETSTKTCTECGEDCVLDDPSDPESWVHAPWAHDQGDHTAEV